MTQTIITDVSFWNARYEPHKAIDFKKMREKVHGTIIRAGQRDYPDNEFFTSWDNAKKAGLLRGSYWFYDSRAKPKRQAELLCQLLGDDLGEMEIWLDFEEEYGDAYQGWENWYDFAENIKLILPEAKLGVYTNFYYWIERVKKDSVKEYFGQYPLWVARYEAQKPLIPDTWTDWLLWQYTSNGDGHAYGSIGKDVDLNYFNGTEEDLYKRYEVKNDNTIHVQPSRWQGRGTAHPT